MKTCIQETLGMGIFSTSLVKIPTTLGGGIVVTKDRDLIKIINDFNNQLPKSYIIYLKYFLKILYLC